MIFYLCRLLACTVICLGAITATFGAVGAAGEPNWGDWAQSVRKDYPLAGDYYAVSAVAGGPARGRYPAAHRGPALRKEPGPRPYVILLGEVHDNPAHHQVRAWMIENTARTFPDWRPAIVFEQISTDQKAAIDKFNGLMEA